MAFRHTLPLVLAVPLALSCGSSTGSGNGHANNESNENAAAECALSIDTDLTRLRIGGRGFHYGPICTPIASGHWQAIVVTGTPEEATDVWVVTKGGDELGFHRVHRAPVGVHYTGGTIHAGIAYLVGQTLAPGGAAPSAAPASSGGSAEPAAAAQDSGAAASDAAATGDAAHATDAGAAHEHAAGGHGGAAHEHDAGAPDAGAPAAAPAAAGGADELPPGIDVLVAFHMPATGDPDPEAMDLTPTMLPLLGAHDRAELTRRLTAMHEATAPSAENATTAARRIMTGGAAALIESLPATGEVPVLRAWQVGTYEHVANLEHSTAATAPEAVAAAAVVHGIEQTGQSPTTLDCTSGSRCVSKAAPAPTPLPDASVPSQVLFHANGSTLTVAAIIEQGHRSEAQGTPSNDHLGAAGYDAPDDHTLATALTLDGTVEGRVTGISRGPVHIIAWSVTAGARHYSAIMLVAPNRAPRRFDDIVFNGLTTGPHELAFRDVERNFEPEVIDVTQLPGNHEAVGASTLLWPPAAADRATYPRLDVMRVAVGASNLADADRLLRTYAAPNADHDATCAALDHMATEPPRALAASIAGVLNVIDYETPGQPLFGTVRHTPVAELRRATEAAAVLGPFAGAHCTDLLCDFFQGYCRRPIEGRESGYLWLTGHRPTPIWGYSKLGSGSSGAASGSPSPSPAPASGSPSPAPASGSPAPASGSPAPASGGTHGGGHGH